MTQLIREPWLLEALCVAADIDPDWFHPGKRTRPRDVLAALALCEHCPVRGACLQYALEYDDLWGIWGGTSPEQRAVILRAAA